jgi:SAM-dependent methyltransferase
MNSKANADTKTIDGFGDEWSRFNQTTLSDEELNSLFNAYFNIFPWANLPAEAVGFDLGCGSGRWGRCVAPRVARLHCIDPSPDALNVARKNLAGFSNCEFHLAAVDDIPLSAGTMDFGYALGVLHHVPDTLAGIAACARLLKPGAPFLLYLYYAFDNQPIWYRCIWQLTDVARHVISRTPLWLRHAASQIIAAAIYYPLARLSLLLERMGRNVGCMPLSVYRNKSFYTMRTDALDRFGTRLEHRFTIEQIRNMMQAADLENIQFSESPPYWCAVGYKKKMT